MHLEIQKPDEHSKMTLPYIYLCILKKSAYDKRNSLEEVMQESDYDRVPWLASQTDILANDWIILK